MNPFSFNLIDEPWIPCLTKAGQMVELSLRATLTKAHELQDLGCDSPLQMASIYRFLLAILHDNFGPRDLDTWEALWQAETFDTAILERYFQRYHPHFDLFGEGQRFYQRDDQRVQAKSAVSLKYSTGFLHNPLFDHDNELTGIAFTPAETARLLLAVQQFGFGGLSGIEQKHTDAPCAKGVIFIVQGDPLKDSLKETLLLNLIRYPYRNYFVPTEFDAPAWQQDNPFDPLEFERTDLPFGYLDYLTWQNRQVWFYPEKTEDDRVVVRAWKVGPGLRLGEVKDPMKHYKHSEQYGFLVEQFDQNRQLWRNSYTYFALQDNTRKDYPPRTFDWLKALAEEGKIPLNRTFRCKALGIDKDRGKALIARKEEFPLPIKYLYEERLLWQLQDALQRTEKTSRALLKSLRISGMHLHIDNADQFGWKRAGIRPKAEKQISDFVRDQIDHWLQHAGVERYFWADLDEHFEKFAIGLADDEQQQEAIDQWRQRVRTAAKDAFRNTLQTTGDTPRAYKALVYGQRHLYRRLNDIFPKPQEKEVAL
ncbi:MAG: type I-E CRISPR-associated protein Cse1/CasA [Anaerolineae bacterium]|nr:type I-E CRISPR-associated protein Cse1/CasA [Anaerolineae bacterium]